MRRLFCSAVPSPAVRHRIAAANAPMSAVPLLLQLRSAAAAPSGGRRSAPQSGGRAQGDASSEKRRGMLLAAPIFPVAVWYMMRNDGVEEDADESTEGPKHRRPKAFQQLDSNGGITKADEEALARERARESRERHKLGGGFTLVSAATGKPATNHDVLDNRWTLLYFGFTKCAVVCPTTLSFIADVLKECDRKNATGRHTETVKTLGAAFVSVDHIRDNTKNVQQFVSKYHPRIAGYCGSKEQIAEAARAWRIYFSSVDETDDEKAHREAASKGTVAAPAPTDDAYQFDHSSAIYLVGPDGKIKDFFFKEVGAETTCKRIGLHFDDVYDLNS